MRKLSEAEIQEARALIAARRNFLRYDDLALAAKHTPHGFEVSFCGPRQFLWPLLFWCHVSKRWYMRTSLDGTTTLPELRPEGEVTDLTAGHLKLLMNSGYTKYVEERLRYGW